MSRLRFRLQPKRSLLRQPWGPVSDSLTQGNERTHRSIDRRALINPELTSDFAQQFNLVKNCFYDDFTFQSR